MCFVIWEYFDSQEKSCSQTSVFTSCPKKEKTVLLFLYLTPFLQSGIESISLGILYIVFHCTQDTK